jgi:hypothetical protein
MKDLDTYLPTGVYKAIPEAQTTNRPPATRFTALLVPAAVSSIVATIGELMKR